jgi:hypothetical protein
MINSIRRFVDNAALTATAAALLIAVPAGSLPAAAQTPAGSNAAVSASSHDRWLHVRVTSPDSKEENVRVNIPLELAEKVLPTFNKNRMHSGRVKLNDIDCGGVDVRALVDAVRTSKDGEFVSVQNKDSDIRVAKQGGMLLVHVFDHHHAKSQVEVRAPIKVVDALFSAGKDELDLVAALHALSAQGDTELVSVRNEENVVRVWLDSKNVTD